MMMIRCVNCTTDIGPEFGDIRPLDEESRCKLKENRTQLLDLIDPSRAFVTELAKVGCITWPQTKHILENTQPRERNYKLVDFITRGSVASFNKFRNVLSRQQARLVQLLHTVEGEALLLV